MSDQGQIQSMNGGQKTLQLAQVLLCIRSRKLLIGPARLIQRNAEKNATVSEDSLMMMNA